MARMKTEWKVIDCVSSLKLEEQLNKLEDGGWKVFKILYSRDEYDNFKTYSIVCYKENE